MSERWDRHWMKIAIEHAAMSKDPSSQVGAAIIGPHKETRSLGFNGFPSGILDLPERYEMREIKYQYIIHAEMNAILLSAKIGTPTFGCTMYLPFGGPCSRCAVCIIQAGISEVVCYPLSTLPERWLTDMTVARTMFEEAGVKVRELEPLP